jgi:hypothetical protein
MRCYIPTLQDQEFATGKILANERIAKTSQMADRLARNILPKQKGNTESKVGSK